MDRNASVSWTSTPNHTAWSTNLASCMHKENNIARTFGIIVTIVGVIENVFLLVAIAAYWSKFLSNLYRFVVSLVCAELLLSLSSLAFHILKYYDSDLNTMALVKGTYAAAHITSIFSICLVNTSVFFTYSRFSTMLLEQQHRDEEDIHHAARMRRYFRRPAAAYTMIISIWIITAIVIGLAVITRCTFYEHGCHESCTTVLGFDGREEIAVCKSSECGKLLSPLSWYYTLMVLIISWVCFILLIGSTITVVFVKVTVRPAKMVVAYTDPSKEGTTATNEHASTQVDQSPIRDNVINNNIKENTDETLEDIEQRRRAIDGTIETRPNKTDEEKAMAMKRKRSQSIHYEIKRKFGFNRDLMSRFSLLTTATQVIIWLPVTVMLLYTIVADSFVSTMFNFEISQIFFALPSIIHPWICVLTMSKLRDAISRTYYNICH